MKTPNIDAPKEYTMWDIIICNVIATVILALSVRDLIATVRAVRIRQERVEDYVRGLSPTSQTSSKKFAKKL